MRVITEKEFQQAFIERLKFAPRCDYVVGPGRSGAIAAVYASHFLGVPFLPYKRKMPGVPLIVDTAISSGRTLRKASNYYSGAFAVFAFDQKVEGDRFRFWYEELSMSRGKGNEYVNTTRYWCFQTYERRGVGGLGRMAVLRK